MSNGKISAKQQEILEYIKSQLLAKGYPPSVREICEAVHLKSTFFRSLSSRDPGEEWLYPKRPYQAKSHRDP